MRDVDIRVRGFDLTDAMKAYVDRRAAFALTRFGDEITAAQLRVDDVNGPRGGVDKRCSLRLKTRRAGELMVELIEADFYAAVDRLVDRSARALDRALSRKRDSRRPARQSSV